MRSRARSSLSECQSRLSLFAIALLAIAGVACQLPPTFPTGAEVADSPADLERQALEQQIEQLNRTVRRLRRDLTEAEQALVSAESGLSQNVTRADAVSVLAESRILVQRARALAPWRTVVLGEAEAKLEAADLQIREEHFGAAVFFCGRAERLARGLIEEGRATEDFENVSWITGERVNLRSGPSTDHPVVAVLTSQTPVFRQRRARQWALVRTPRGELGWVFESLLDDERP